MLDSELFVNNSNDLIKYDTKRKLYGKFEQAAIQGAMMIIDGKIAPLNPL